MACVSGSAVQLATKAGSGAVSFANDTGGTRKLWEIESESLKKSGTQIDLAGIRGTRARRVESISEGPYSVAGSIILKASPAVLDYFLPFMLGGTESANTFPVAETLPDFSILIDRIATIATRGTFEYSDLKVGKWILRGSKTQAVRLELQLMGKTEIADSEAFPTLSLGTGAAERPYVHEQCSFLYNSVNVPFSSFEISCDNVLEERRENTMTAEDICPTDRIIMVRLDTPWQNVTAPLYDIAPAAGSFIMSAESNDLSCTIDFGRLVQPTDTPNIQNRGRIPWNLQLEARSNGATADIQVTNDPEE